MPNFVDATYATAPVTDPVVGPALTLIEARIDPNGIPSARVVLGFYRQSGALDHEEGIAVTDGGPENPQDDYFTGRGPLFGEPVGIIMAMLTPLPEETAQTFAMSPSFALRARVMNWLVQYRPELFSGMELFDYRTLFGEVPAELKKASKETKKGE